LIDEYIKKIIEDTVKTTLKELGATKNDKSEAPEIMDVKQLAEYLNVSTSYIYQNKQIPCERRGRKITFYKKDVDSWRQSQKEEKQQVRNITINKSKGNIYKIS
jgi:excisionase family DNA binding protein